MAFIKIHRCHSFFFIIVILKNLAFLYYEDCIAEKTKLYPFKAKQKESWKKRQRILLSTSLSSGICKTDLSKKVLTSHKKKLKERIDAICAKVAVLRLKKARFHLGPPRYQTILQLQSKGLYPLFYRANLSRGLNLPIWQLVTLIVPHLEIVHQKLPKMTTSLPRLWITRNYEPG